MYRNFGRKLKQNSDKYFDNDVMMRVIIFITNDDNIILREQQ